MPSPSDSTDPVSATRASDHLQEELREPQRLAAGGRWLLGVGGAYLAGTAIWALLMHGKEGAMPTAMIVVGTLLVLIAITGFLPDKLTAGDLALEFARREVYKAADAVADLTPPDQREALAADLAVNAAKAADAGWADVRSLLDKHLRERAMPRDAPVWDLALAASMTQANMLERNVCRALQQAVVEASRRTGRELKLVTNTDSGVDFEVVWASNRRILIEVRLQSTSMATVASSARRAVQEGQRLGFLLLAADFYSRSGEVRLLEETSLKNVVGGPVLIRPPEGPDGLAAYLTQLVLEVDN